MVCSICCSIIYILSWLRCAVVERRSMTGELSLPMLDLYSWRVTTYVGKLSAIGQRTRPTQPFILLGLINWVVIKIIWCVLVWSAIWWVSTMLSRCNYQPLCAMCGSNLAELNPSVYIVPPRPSVTAALRGGCCYCRLRVMPSIE